MYDKNHLLNNSVFITFVQIFTAMPYKINWEEEGVYVKWSELTTANENIRLNGEIYGYEKFDTIKYLISDILDSEFPEYTEKEIRIIAKLDAQASIWNKNLKIAHITKKQAFIDLIKSYEDQMHESGWKFMTFDNLEDARKWLSSE